MGIRSAYDSFVKTEIGNYIHLVLWHKRALREMKEYDDYSFVMKEYKRKTGRDLDLVNPKRYTEKLQWLKIFYRDDLATTCADKIEVKEYLREKGYGDMLNETLAIYESVDEMDLSKLPDRFVIKAAHGSGWNLIVQDKKKVHWWIWKPAMRSWLKQNLYWFGREWPYKEQKPRIIVEKYLEDDSGELRDYKLICLNGNPEFMQIDENRATNHKRIYVDPNGEIIPMDDDSKQYSNDEKLDFGDKHRKMFELARELSAPFPNVRVDFYECDGKIYFGELTYFGGSGFYSFNPDKWDYHWGERLNLPEANYNLELLKRD